MDDSKRRIPLLCLLDYPLLLVVYEFFFFFFFFHFVLQFFVGMGPFALCSSATEIVEKDKRSGYQRLFFIL